MNASPSMTRHFNGKIVVLTGAASGIGRAMAGALAAAGATVHALDSNAAGLESLSLANPGAGEIHPYTLDVSDRASYADVIRKVMDDSSRIDFLFNNAGVTQLGEAQNIPFERWQRLLDINLMGVVHGVALVYPIMIAQGGGHIVNTASIAGGTGYATAAAYTASKAAILELTRSLRSEAKAYGVRVSVACPGYVNSSLFNQESIVGANRDAVLNDLPVRMMTPAEAAGHLLRGVAKGRGSIIFPFSAAFLWTISNWAPVFIGPFHRKFLRVFQTS